MTTHLHRVLSDPDRIRVLDHIAASVEPVTGRQIATSMNVSELWASRYLNQMADVGLIVRDGDTDDNSVRNRIAPGVTWPIGMTAAAHHALSNADRVRIMDHLMAAGPATTGDIAKVIGCTPSTASKHLATLDRVGLIARRRETGGVVYNSIADGVAWPVKVMA